MDFSEIESCQNEIESIKEITKYFQKREASMTVVFDTLAETMTRSQDTCRVLKDVKRLMDRTRELYLYLENRNNLTGSTDSSQCSRNEKKTDTTIVQNEGPSNKSSTKDIMPPASEQKAPCKTRVIRSLLEHKRQASNLDERLTQKDSRARRQSKFSSRKPGTTLTGIQSHSKEVLSRTRIKHNADYPKPWLDPPDKRNHEHGSHQQSSTPATIRRQSVVPFASKQRGAVAKHRRISMVNSQRGYNQLLHPEPNIQRQWRAPMTSSRDSQTEPFRSTQLATMLHREPRRASVLPAAKPTRVYRSSRTRNFGIQKLEKINE